MVALFKSSEQWWQIRGHLKKVNAKKEKEGVCNCQLVPPTKGDHREFLLADYHYWRLVHNKTMHMYVVKKSSM